ncbi:hypothetical protein RJT34_16497 [Clitoria ternatea]|uniref:Uncharacterized protein n=1 Tax=Clitoria ternatea TaxID=43366 RepID=A0AAN9J8S4_CLITE
MCLARLSSPFRQMDRRWGAITLGKLCFAREAKGEKKTHLRASIEGKEEPLHAAAFDFLGKERDCCSSSGLRRCSVLCFSGVGSVGLSFSGMDLACGLRGFVGDGDGVG